LQHVIRECFVTPDAQGRGLGFFAFMAGSVLGAALQLQQAALWERAAYPALPLAAAAGWLLLRCARFVPRLLLPALLLIGAMAGAGLAGWRACAYASEALAPALEGRDLQVVGVVAQMPQRGDGATSGARRRWRGSRSRACTSLTEKTFVHNLRQELSTAAGGRRSSRLMLWRPAPHAALVGGVLLATLYALFSG